MKTWTREQFESLVSVFPEGQLCVVLGKKIIASCSSLIVDFDEYHDTHTWRDISGQGYATNHDSHGDTLHGIEIMVDPEFRGYKLSRRLYNERKKLATKLNLRRIILGGRIPGYHKYADKMSARKYVEKVLDKVKYDPVLTAQLANGFVLIRLIPDYLPGDKESRGYATLLGWTNIDYIPAPEGALTPLYARVCAVQYMMRMIENFDDFAAHCTYFVDVASDYKCDFILFPEMFTSQLLSFMKIKRPAKAMRALSEFTPRYLDLFTKLAIKHNINIIGGSHFAIEDDGLYNISFLFRRDGTIGKQYKIHITPSDIPFQRDGVAAECAPNIETLIFQGLDLRLLKKHRSEGGVLTWQDRRSDLYQISYREEEKNEVF